MPLGIDVSGTLQRAEEYEQKYKWLEAAKSYERLLSCAQEVSFSVAQIWEKLASCYRRASQQTGNQEQFRRLRKKAADAYRKAGESFEKEDNSEGKGNSAHCYALAEYVSSWLVSTPSERRRAFESCCAFTQESLAAFEKAGDQLSYGRVCNDLLLCLLERLYVAHDSEELNNIGQEGIKYTNKAIVALSTTGEKNELLSFYCTSSLLCWYVSNFVEQEEKAQKEQAQRSLDYSLKALTLSKEISDPYSTALSDYAATLCSIAFTENAASALEYAKDMLRQGATAEDNYLKGVALYLLAFVNDMITLKEADPDKKKEGYQRTINYSEEAIFRLSLVSQYHFIAGAYLYYAESYSSLASVSNVSSGERCAMLEKAVEIGRKGLECAIISGSPEAEIANLHVLSKALHSYSKMIIGKYEKSKLLEEALEKRTEYGRVVERVFPTMDWILGVGKHYEALIKVELAQIEIVDKVKKIDVLRSATADMEESILHCKKWIVSHPMPSHVVATAEFEDSFGGILNELYLLTENKQVLTRAIEICFDAARQFKEVDLPSRAAESYWKMARNEDRLGDCQKAAQDFERALTEYQAASERTPHFAEFYQEHANYMKAWSEIERAKFAHELERYAEAMKHYEDAARIIHNTKLWGYLSSDFQALSCLEKAEDLSRKECIADSINAFKEAAELFEDAQRTLNEAIGKIQNPDERENAIALSKASVVRGEYCIARVDVEEARRYDLEGRNVESAEKYGSAASGFEKIMEKTESEYCRKEIKPIAYMCRAWQKMKIADERILPELYHEASELFLEAKEHGTKDRATLLASGNGAFCRALEYGTKFVSTHNRDDFSRAKQYLGSAANYYLKAGFDNASAWTSAAETLIDAFNYMTRAELESNPEIKMREYLLAEKCLERSAELYETTGHIGKKDEVLKILKKVKEKREFALYLEEILTLPREVSSTAAISAPISTVEEPVGLEKFEHELIHANLTAYQKEGSIGEDLDFKIQLANLGKISVFLMRVENIVPEGFDLVEQPKNFHVENESLIMKGKRLDPLKTEEFKVVLRAFAKGTFEMEPRIIYIGETQQEMFCTPERATINISRVVLPNHIAIGCEDIDDMLLGGIPQSYAVILASPSTDEKDLVVRRFLETGAEKGEVTFYVTIDASNVRTLAEECQSNFYLFLCNPHNEIFRHLPNLFSLRGVENLNEINIALASAFRQIDVMPPAPRRACIEIISDLVLQHHALSVRRWLAALIPELRSKGFTTLAVMNPQMHSQQENQAVLDVFEGEISIFEKETKKGLVKFLKIRKMQDQKYIERELPLDKERLSKIGVRRAS